MLLPFALTLTHVSTLDPIDPDALDSGTTTRVTVARAFDSYWTAEACRAPGETIRSLAPVQYATREPRPGDRLRVVRTVTGYAILPPHANDDANGAPIPVAK